MAPLKLVFAGTPDFAAQHLRALLASPHEVLAVYTQPDRPAGRGKKLSPSPVKSLAVAAGLPVFQPLSLKAPEAQAELAALGAELMVVVAYGLLLPKAVLDTPRLGCVNVHGSLLPRWRGAAPIQRAIEAGDTRSGITIMQMDVGLDTGDMLLRHECPVLPTDSAGDLFCRMAELGPRALLDCLSLIAEGRAVAEPQDNAQSSYARKIDKGEAELDWRLPAAVLVRKILAFNPEPSAFTHLDGQRLKVHRARVVNSLQQCAPGKVLCTDGQLLVQAGDGQIGVEQLQLAGKGAVTGRDFINGHKPRIAAGTLVFGA